MSYVIITPPTDYPLTLGGVRDFLQETETVNDWLINPLIASATQWVERKTNRALMTQTIEQRFQYWPSCNLIQASLNPVQTVSVKYLDADGDEITVDPEDYAVWIRNEITQVSFNDDFTWPTTNGTRDAFKVRFVVGYNPPDTIPDPIKDAMLLRIRKAYDKREDEVYQGKMASDHLLEPYIIYLSL